MTEIKDYRESKAFNYKIKMLKEWPKILQYSGAEVYDKHYTKLTDCLIEGFRWDKTPEGQEYWQRIHDSIKLMPSKKCCGKIMKPNDFGAYYKCRVCKKITK